MSLSGAAGARAVAQEVDAATCVLRVEVEDEEGRRLDARGELLDPAAASITSRGDSLCLGIDAPHVTVRLLVSAAGFQPHATDPLALSIGDRRTLLVTLSRPFAETLTVRGQADAGVGHTPSASSGVLTAADLAARPIVRAGDILGAVPGVAITQHSSGGHAPIILLRGYNLDHGTDFATSLAGAPLNLPSHAHAQGYTDTNFLIEDVVERIEFQKGPYSARVGNFGTAVAANIELADSVAEPFARLEAGAHGFARLLGVTSMAHTERRWLLAAEASHDDGPSDVPDAFRRLKGVVRYSSGPADRRIGVTLASYGASWNATDGYPDRALEQGDVGRYGTLDPSDGGRTQQHLVTATRRSVTSRGIADLGAYARYYDLDLFSNLTFWTRSGDLGDQIWQSDRRASIGGHAAVTRVRSADASSAALTAGAEVRHDAARVRLLGTAGRTPIAKRTDAGVLLPSTTYDNGIGETAMSPYVDLRVQAQSWLRIAAALRGDVIRMHVTSDRPENSGTRWAGLASPKGAVSFGPWNGTELHVNAGLGFHSNHAAGVLQRVDPITGTPVRLDGTTVENAPPMVRTRGIETGITTVADRLRASLALWLIDSDSELVYTAEDGVTSPERPGRRYGLEWLTTIATAWGVTADLDAAWSSARYRSDPHGEGTHIPDAAGAVAGAGVGLAKPRVAASLRARYVGRRPLTPSGATYVEHSFVVNGQADVLVTRRVRVGVQVFNLMNRRYEDTAYYYATRLRDPRTGALEPAAVDDRVTHPAQPRTVRVGVRLGL